MNLQDFRELEKKLGHPPTQEEVRAHERQSKLKAASVKFKDSRYNYVTSVNGKLSDEEIVAYFKDKWFNMGHIEDDMQKCIDCEVQLSTIHLN